MKTSSNIMMLHLFYKSPEGRAILYCEISYSCNAILAVFSAYLLDETVTLITLDCCYIGETG